MKNAISIWPLNSWLKDVFEKYKLNSPGKLEGNFGLEKQNAIVWFG